MTPPLTPDHLAELRRLAGEAREGPWRARVDDRAGDGLWLVETDHGIPDDVALYVEAADAPFLAAVSPDVVLSLLEAARREARVRAALEPFLRAAANEASRPHIEDGYLTGPSGLAVGDWRTLDAAGKNQ